MCLVSLPWASAISTECYPLSLRTLQRLLEGPGWDLEGRGWLSLGAFICQMGLKHNPVLGCGDWKWSRGLGCHGPVKRPGL